MHIDPVRLAAKWLPPGEPPPRARILYRKRFVERIARAFAEGNENPYRPRAYSRGPEWIRIPSTAPTDVPPGWATTAELQLLLMKEDLYFTVRAVRELLTKSATGTRAQSSDAFLTKVFALLLSSKAARRSAPPVPSLKRHLRQRLERVYPQEAALAYLRSIAGNRRSRAHVFPLKAWVDALLPRGLTSKERGRRARWIVDRLPLIVDRHRPDDVDGAGRALRRLFSRRR